MASLAATLLLSVHPLLALAHPAVLRSEPEEYSAYFTAELMTGGMGRPVVGCLTESGRLSKSNCAKFTWTNKNRASGKFASYSGPQMNQCTHLDASQPANPVADAATGLNYANYAISCDAKNNGLREEEELAPIDGRDPTVWNRAWLGSYTFDQYVESWFVEKLPTSTEQEIPIFAVDWLAETPEGMTRIALMSSLQEPTGPFFELEEPM